MDLETGLTMGIGFGIGLRIWIGFGKNPLNFASSSCPLILNFAKS